MGEEQKPTGIKAAIGPLKKALDRELSADDLERLKPLFHLGSGERRSTGLLLIHGFTSGPASINSFVGPLQDAGYSLSIPLLPGHCTSPEDLVGITWQQWLDTVLNAYDQLAESCDRIVPIGLSLGGALAFNLATLREVKQIVVLAPAIYPSFMFSLLCNIVRPVMTLFGARFWPNHVGGDVKKEGVYELCYGKTAFDGVVALDSCMKATASILDQVKADVLMFQSRVDHEIPANKASKILDALGSKNKELIWLDNSYHVIPNDNDADFVLQKIMEFIFTPNDTPPETARPA